MKCKRKDSDKVLDATKTETTFTIAEPFTVLTHEQFNTYYDLIAEPQPLTEK